MQMDFLWNALFAGIGIALVAGPLGSLMVWRRMANFGDAMSHSTLLGVALAFILQVHLYAGLFAVCIVTAILLGSMTSQKQLANETLLTLIAQVILALGLILASIQTHVRIDLLGYLYGDILAVDTTDLFWIAGIDVIVLVVLFLMWRSILSMIIHEDLARVEGVPVQYVKWTTMILIAAVFAIAMKLVGALLITALLIIPAGGARQLAKSPLQMMIGSVLLGIFAVCLGLVGSNAIDVPTGPAIVIASMMLFIFCVVLRKWPMLKLNEKGLHK